LAIQPELTFKSRISYKQFITSGFWYGESKMALTKEVVIDQMTVLEDGQIQVRKVTRTMEGGVELSKSYHRHVVSPGDDLTKEDKRVADIGKVVHTKAVKDAFKAKQG
jgi:hypothetical protein